MVPRMVLVNSYCEIAFCFVSVCLDGTWTVYLVFVGVMDWVAALLKIDCAA